MRFKNQWMKGVSRIAPAVLPIATLVGVLSLPRCECGDDTASHVLG